MALSFHQRFVRSSYQAVALESDLLSVQALEVRQIGQAQALAAAPTEGVPLEVHFQFEIPLVQILQKCSIAPCPRGLSLAGVVQLACVTVYDERYVWRCVLFYV